MTRDYPLSRQTSRWLLLIGILVAALGLAVIAGWHAHAPLLIQLHPALMPMQYNTALGFVLGGAALVALAWQRVALAQLAAGAVALLGAATLGQYMTGADFGIDQLLMAHEIVARAAHPGRMAQGSAIAFLLLGTGLLLLSRLDRYRFAAEITALLGTTVVALASATLVGYAADLKPLTGWGAGAYMALHTAMGILLLGAALITGSGIWSGRRGADSLYLGGVASFYAILLLSLLLWSGLERHQDERANAALTADARWFAARVDAEYLARVGTLDRMGKRWESSGGTPRAIWEADAESYIRDLPGFQALEWVDTSGRVRWVVPLAGNERAAGLDLTLEPVRAATLARARNERRAVASAAVSLAQGGEGFLLLRPLFVGNRFDGYLLAVFRIESMVDGLVGRDLMFGDVYTLEREGRVVYRGASSDAVSGEEQMAPAMALAMGDGKWILRMSSGLAGREGARSALPLVVLGSGILVALFVGIVFWMWGLTARRAGIVARANAALTESEERFRNLADAAPALIWMSDTSNHGTWYNKRWFEYTGRTMEQELGLGWAAGVHPDDLDRCVAYCNEAFNARRPFEMEFRLRRADGSYGWIADTGVPRFDANGKFEGYVGYCWDISDRKQAEESLNEKQQSLRLALKASHAGFYVLDLVRARGEWDDRAYAVYGQSRDTFDTSFENITGAVIPEDQDMLRRFGELLQSRGTDWHEIYRVKGADGGIRTIEGFGYVMRAPDNTPLRVIGTVTDITDRRRAEEALFESNERLRLIAETVSEVFWMADAEMRQMLYISPAYETVWQRSCASLYENPRSFIEGIYPDDRDRVIAGLRQNQPHGQPFAHKYRVLRPDGTIRWVWDRGFPVTDPNGVVQRYVGIVQDITEQMRAEQALRDSAGRIRAIVDNVVDGIITIDESGRIESYNASAERIFGYSLDEVLGRNISMLMPEPYRSRHDAYLANYTNGGVPQIIGVGREVEGLRKDGTIFPLELAVGEVWTAGRRIFTGVVRDITERKKVERLKSEFISTVSHELRTPLTSIRGSLGLLAGGAIGELPSQVKQLIDIAHKNSERLSRLINDILDIERMASGKMRFDLRPHPLMPLVEQTLAANQAYAAQHGIHFAITARVENGEIRVDAERFQQVMANLLSNAAKFSPRGATVEIAVERRPDRLQVSVSDRGPGVPADFRPRVFEKFSQADASDTRAKGGSGLGLAISREIVERMNGRIGFDTEEGVGTTFRIEFPVWHAAPAIAAVSTAGATTRLLVVEDDPDVARLLVLMLQNGGFKADVAHDAETAKQLLAANRYEAMTLDLLLPGQDGISLIRELRARPETLALPIVVVSARVEEGRLAINSDFAAIDWLGKPIDEQRLIAAVSAVVDRVQGYKPRVLHVEDDFDLHQIMASIADRVAEFDHAATIAEAREKLSLERYSLVVLDLTLPDGSSWELLPQLQALDPAPPVIVLSGREVTEEEADRVQAALVKSQTGNVELLGTLRRVIREAAGAAP